MKALGAAAFLAAALATPAAPLAQAERGNLLRCVVPAVPESGRLATCTGRVGQQPVEWTFTLVGRAPNIVTRIEIHQPGREEPRQVIEGFEARPPLVRGDLREPGRVDFVLQDVNFDRHGDLRIALGPPEQDGTAYRWFLFDKDAEAFAVTDAPGSRKAWKYWMGVRVSMTALVPWNSPATTLTRPPGTVASGMRPPGNSW